MTALKNETDKIIYEYIKANGFITTHQILGITGITTMAGASVALGRLMDAKLIEKVRQGRQFIYQLKNKVLVQLENQLVYWFLVDESVDVFLRKNV